MDVSQPSVADDKKARCHLERADNFDKQNGDTSPERSSQDAPQFEGDSYDGREQSTRFREIFLEPEQGSIDPVEKQNNTMQRSASLKKRHSTSRKGSLRRCSSSHKPQASPAGAEAFNSVFFLPVPTQSNPTDILVDRFSAWRRLLKDYISYFKEAQLEYEHRAKAIGRLYQSLNSSVGPGFFLQNGGILDATLVLRGYHKSSSLANEHARQGLNRIVALLTGLRDDLGIKIKEIKGLSGDFKNNLEKERDGTLRAVAQLTEALSAVDSNASVITGKNDPYLIKLAVDRQVRKQLAEENYLHRAYLNLEGSGRELEGIVIGEIQKAFECYVKILRNEGSEMLETVERLELQALGLPRDHEWTSFVEREPNFVDPKVNIRSFEDIEYPGIKHPAAREVRSGPLERKSKYLKSYTPGWYTLSSSHLHEFKTSDRSHELAPVMSLYLPESTIGNHTGVNSSSHKFIVKGKQTGHMHRGHSWVFRADSHLSMMGFYEDIKKLIDLSGVERTTFLSSHLITRQSALERGDSSTSSENELENHDEADEIPFSMGKDVDQHPPIPNRHARPEAGRFPSDIDVPRHNRKSTTSNESDKSLGGTLLTPIIPTSDSESQERDRDVNISLIADAGTDTVEGLLNWDRSIASPFSTPTIQDSSARNTNERELRQSVVGCIGPVLSVGAYGDLLQQEDNSEPVRENVLAQTNLLQGNAGIASASTSKRTMQHLSRQSTTSTIWEVPSQTLSSNCVANTPTDASFTSHPPLSGVPVSEYQMLNTNPGSSFRTFPGATSRTDSNFTISELHVPGEFPDDALALK